MDSRRVNPPRSSGIRTVPGTPVHHNNRNSTLSSRTTPSSAGVPSIHGAPLVNKHLPSKQSGTGKQLWTALYEYQAKGEDELSLRKNDLIEVLSMDCVISGDEGWWTGKCNGKVGVFPCNFVAPADLDFSNLKRDELLRFYPPHIGKIGFQMSHLSGSESRKTQFIT